MAALEFQTEKEILGNNDIEVPLKVSEIEIFGWIFQLAVPAAQALWVSYNP